ncbi:MAG TPA: SDR family oxidoreductase [Spirochaetia bacterium]|nr:SDR family oxidoreductase [Spirochaetia bacterium]
MSAQLFDLTGCTAVVTGGSRGLGSYMARALAGAGARVVITARKASDCETTLGELRSISEAAGTSAEPAAFSLDVTDRESIVRFGDAVSSLSGGVQILVNNAGCNIRKPFLDFTWEEWDRVLDTNLKGGFFVTQAVAPGMIERRYGRIINIGSVTTAFGYAGIAPYCASRGGVGQVTKALADELGPHGITVNCLAPGWFQTEQNKALYESREWLAYITDRIPVKRPGKPHDLDGAVIFLASRESEYVSGQTLFVDGGITTGATKAAV